MAFFLFIVSLKLEQINNSFNSKIFQEYFYFPGTLCFFSDFFRIGNQDFIDKVIKPTIEKKEIPSQTKSQDQIKEDRGKEKELLFIYKFAPILICGISYLYLFSDRKKNSDFIEICIAITSCSILIFLVNTARIYKKLLDKDSDSLDSYARLITYTIHFAAFPFIYTASPFIQILVALKSFFIFIIASITTIIVLVMLFNGITNILSTAPIWFWILLWYIHFNKNVK